MKAVAAIRHIHGRNDNIDDLVCKRIIEHINTAHHINNIGLTNHHRAADTTSDTIARSDRVVNTNADNANSKHTHTTTTITSPTNWDHARIMRLCVFHVIPKV